MESNNYFFTYTKYETFDKKIKFVSPAKEYNFENFIHDTSICTSTMIIKRNIIKDIKFTEKEFARTIFLNVKF